MIKKGSFRRIIIASLAFILVIVSIYLFPQNEVKIPKKTTYVKADTNAIYLIDKNNYVARTKINIDGKDKSQVAKELIDALINGTSKNKYLPQGFKSLIPSGTILKNVTIDNDLINVYFNEKLFDTKDNNEEKIIESLVYTLTEIDGINKVKIYVNDELLTRLPSSNKILPEVLTRKIGINKKMDFINYKNTQEVTTYFKSSFNDNDYYVPITFITDNQSEKIEVIIKELESKSNIDKNLSTYIAAGTELKNYQILENELNIEFNNAIFNSFNKIDEEVMYGIALSIYDNYNIKKVSFEVNNKKIDTYELKTS